MRVTRAARGNTFVSASCCRQNCAAASQVQPSRLSPDRSTRANCSPGAQDTTGEVVTGELDPLDRPDPGDPGIKLPNQAQSIVEGNEQQLVTVLEREDKKDGAETDYLQVGYCPCLHELSCSTRGFQRLLSAT